MNVRFSQLIGWISLVLAFTVAHAADEGALTAAQMVGGSLLGVCGLMAALIGQCMAVQRARRGRGPRAARVPVRTARRPGRCEKARK